MQGNENRSKLVKKRDILSTGRILQHLFIYVYNISARCNPYIKSHADGHGQIHRLKLKGEKKPFQDTFWNILRDCELGAYFYFPELWFS